MFTLTLTQTAVKGFVSSDSMRPALRGIHFNAEKQRLEMTNGHVLAMVPLSSEEKSVVLPVKAFPKVFWNETDVEHIDGNRWTVTERHPKKGVVSERIVTTIEEKFPDVQMLKNNMPEPEPVEQIAVDPSFFKPFYILDKQTGGAGMVKITFHGQKHAMLIQSNGDEDRFTGLLMPVRMR